MSSTLTLEFLKQQSAGPPLVAHPVPVYELGPGMIAWIAELSADERDARMEIPWLKHKEESGRDDNVGFRAFLVAACLCDSQARTFVAKTPEEVGELAALLGQRDSRPITRMFVKAQEANGVGKDQVEELEKNLPPSVAGSGTKPSPPDSPAPASGSAT